MKFKILALATAGMMAIAAPAVTAKPVYGDWGYNPTRDMAGELRGMFEDLAPHKDRIVEKLHVICPDIRWGGEKKICESLLGDSQ